jgi:hypothetical protein
MGAESIMKDHPVERAGPMLNELIQETFSSSVCAARKQQTASGSEAFRRARISPMDDLKSYRPSPRPASQVRRTAEDRYHIDLTISTAG